MSKSRRSKTKYPALNKRLNLKARQEQLTDFDYVNGYTDPETGESFRALNDEEKAFLNNFIEEEINANLNHPGPKFNKSKKDKKRVYNANNARNRCVLSRAKARGRVLGFDDLPDSFTKEGSPEDSIIETIDLKKIIKND